MATTHEKYCGINTNSFAVCSTFILLLLMVFSNLDMYSQNNIYISSYEFHWIKGAVPAVIQPVVSKQLSENNFHIVTDSNNADLVVKIRSNSYYHDKTPYFFFALLDAGLMVYDRKKHKQVYLNDILRIKGGGTTPGLADDKVYSNASHIIADTLAGFLYFYATGKPLRLIKETFEIETMCDADREIPVVSPFRKNTYVLIIANDAYSPMQMARCFSDSIDYHARDARVFREYAIRSLGIPAENVQMVLNAKSFEMRREIIKLASYSRGVDGNAELILYYAGLGLIDEKTLEPYLLPVDIENDDPKFTISVSDLYKMLQEDASKRITILLETSFAYDALKPKPEKSKTQKIQLRYPNVPANFFLMAAGTPGQKTWSDQVSGHNLFTLALLDKLKESKGNASLKELSDYINKEVRSVSLKMKLKEQIPRTLTGSLLEKNIRNLKL